MSLIYHYTTIDGFMGIFSKCTKENPNVTMRATHSMYLNDPSEYKLGREICKKILLEVEAELEIPEHKRLSKAIYSPERVQHREFADYIFSTIPDTLDWGMPYLFSLSKNKDCLPMWTTYAKNGQGLALGFDMDKLRIEHTNLKIENCCYDVVTDTNFMIRRNKIKERCRSLYENRKDDEDNENDVLIEFKYGMWYSIFRDELLYIKHHGYDYEREVRCVAVKDKRNDSEDVILFRNSSNMIIPYVERHIDVNCLKRIVIGPCADKEKMRSSLIMFLKDKIENISSLDIVNSKIPYVG